MKMRLASAMKGSLDYRSLQMQDIQELVDLRMMANKGVAIFLAFVRER
jgi:hypothetical protein